MITCVGYTVFYNVNEKLSLYFPRDIITGIAGE